MEISGTVLQPSVSIGVVSYPDDGTTSDELMITADSSMYRSKRAGKNRVTGVPVMVPPADPERADELGTDIVANLEANLDKGLEIRGITSRRARGRPGKSV